MKKRFFEVVKQEHRTSDREITLPKRGSSKSAGYDFVLPIDVELYPGETRLVFTDVKAFMQDNEVLKLYIRSSVGVKKGIILANGTGIIDSDYYSNESNDGNIGIPLYNNSNKTVTLEAGTRIAQGIFVEYLIVDDEPNEDVKRKGGFGSTD